MAHQIFSSCSKTSGIPLIPPFITSDIATEIQYYKRLFVAVQERLKALEIAKNTALNINDYKLNKVNDDIFAGYITAKVDFESDNTVISTMTSIDTKVIDYPTKDNSENLIDIDSPVFEQINNENSFVKDINIFKSDGKTLEHIDESILNKDKSSLNEIFSGDSIYSDTITSSTDIHQYLNMSVSTKTDTAETTPENRKLQVPKSLAIVPITLGQLKLPDKSSSADGETPKLIRQDSYVLDAPSPMLLAHMQCETATSEYTPTSFSQLVRNKEWNINQVKTDWKTQSNLKEPISSRLNSVNRSRRTGHTNISSQRICKSVSNSKSGSPLDVFQPAKSVDCIHAMFDKECYCPKTDKNKMNNQSQKYSSPVGINSISNRNFKKPIKTTSILNLANKMSGSLGNLGIASAKPVRRIEKKNSNESRLNKSFDEDCVKTNYNSNSLTRKQKPFIMSEKIITVFREIQDTHKKQMLELMTRQQREQILMQDNFKKQQILLLAQIRKAFPEISISSLSEAISNKSAGRTTHCSSKTENEKFGVNQMHINGIQFHEKDKQTLGKSPMDNCPSKKFSSTSCPLSHHSISPAAALHHQSNSQATQTLNNSSPMLNSDVNLSNIEQIDDIPVGNPVQRYSCVSRQLFPLDSKPVPVIDNSMYREKHTKAATIITAYMKGFLTRRLMKTEKVIALKNTYREALHCMLRLHVDSPLNLPELNFHKRLQLQCDAASMNIVDLFSQNPTKWIEIIAHDREIKKARSDRPSSARSYSFATQRTLARKKLKEMGVHPSLQSSVMSKSCPARARCQTWTSNTKERRTTSFIRLKNEIQCLQ